MTEDEFAEHVAWQTTTQITDLIAELEAREDFSHADQIARIRYVVAQAVGHCEPSDVALYSARTMDELQAALSKVLSELVAARDNNNLGHIDNAVPHAEIVLHKVNLLPVEPPRGGAVAAANRAFTAYRIEAEGALERVTDQNRTLQQEIADQRVAHDAKIATLKEQIDGLTSQITDQKTRIDTAATQQTDQFNASQTERTAKFSEWLTDQGGSLSELASENLDEIAEHLRQAQEAHKKIDSLRDETEKLAGVAAGDIVARGFRKNATLQHWTGLAVYALGFASLGVGGYSLLHILGSIEPDATISWQFTALRVALTGAFVYGAVVAFQLGSRLLTDARVAKQFELELKALVPLFPAAEDESALREVKQDLIGRSFGKAWSASENLKHQPVSNDALLAVLPELLRAANGKASTSP